MAATTAALAIFGTPSADAQPAAPGAPGAAGASTAAEPRFDVWEFVVQGNTVLAPAEIERAVYPFLGAQRTFSDVEAAREALQRAYRERGFGTVSVDIPEQRADGGEIVLEVQEGRIARTRVTGSRYFSQGYILSRLSSAAEGSVPHLPTLQAELGSVNRTPDRRVLPVLRPGRLPGTTELDLTVEDRLPAHGTLEVNNRQSPNTSATRLSASLRHDNLFQRDHSLAFTAQVTPENRDESQVLGATWSVPMGEAGQDSLVVTATRSRGEVESGVADTFVQSRSQVFGLRRSLTLDIQPGRYQLATLGVELKALEEDVVTGGAVAQSTPITYLPLAGTYYGSFDDARGRWQLGGGLTVGLRGLVNEEGEFAQRRFRARASFAVLRMDLTREHKLPAEFGLRVRADMQLTGQPLVPSEQFSAGGADSVRGYLESAIVGDNGLRGSIELRSPELAPKAWSAAVSSLTLLGFIEGAVTEAQKPLPAQRSRFALLGAGLGLRAKGPLLTNLAIDFGWALRDLVTGVKSDGSGLAVGSALKGDLRVHASASLEF